jgi:hypothetical protein
LLTATIELKAEQDRNDQSVRVGGDLTVIASQAKCNLETVPESLDKQQVQQQSSDLRRSIFGILPALEAIKYMLRPWMILELVCSANAHPTHFEPEGLVQLSALDLVPNFGGAMYLGQRMASAIGFQLSQDRSIYGLVLLSIALTGISSFTLYDSTGNGVACLFLVFIL